MIVFEIYERIGFAETFLDLWGHDDSELAGMKFSVISRVKEFTKGEDNGMDLGLLPMWNIRFENGDTTAAFPEEICLAERLK